jgi:hypothetical protein
MLDAGIPSVRLEGSVIGSLHNKHGYARGEHCHCRDRHDDPSQAGTRLALHQFLSEATTRIATRRKGANRPLMTAVQ